MEWIFGQGRKGQSYCQYRYGACQGQAEHLTAITSSEPQMPYPLQAHDAQSEAVCAEKLEWRQQSGKYQLVPLTSLNSQALYI